MRRFNTTTGFPTPAAEKAHSLDLNELIIHNRPSTYFLRASGDRPELGIAKGDVLIVDRSLNPREGDIAIVVEDNELHLKEVTPLAIRSWTNANLQGTPTLEELFGIVTWIMHETRSKR